MGRRSVRRKRASRLKRTRNMQFPDAEGILGCGTMSITGPTTTVEYLKMVKSIFIYEPSIYRKFVKTMTDYQKEKIDIVEALNNVVLLFDGYPHLIRDFKVFLPEGYTLEIQEHCVVIKVYERVNNDEEEDQTDDGADDTVDYITKVREVFKNEPEKFKKFTKILTDYHTKKCDEVNTVQRIVVLLRKHPFLVLHFNQFLPDGHEIHMFDNSQYTIEYPIMDGRKAVCIKAQ